MMGMNSISSLLNDLSIKPGTLDIVIDESNINQILEEHLPTLISNLYSGDLEILVRTTITLRKILAIEVSPPIEQIIKAGIVPRLIQLLNIGNVPHLQFEAAWALTNIASGTTEQTKFVIDNGAIEAFVTLLNNTDNDDVKEQAVWGIGNLASEVEDRDTILNYGVISQIIDILKNYSSPSKLNIIRNTSWVLSNLCRGKPKPSFKIIEPTIPVLANLLNNHLDEEVLIDVCWTLFYLTDGYQDEDLQKTINANVCPRLIKLLDHPDDRVIIPALRTIGNFATGDNIQTQVILDLMVLPRLLNLLKSPSEIIVRETCWTISNIVAGSKHQVQQVITSNIFPVLVDLMGNEDTDDIIVKEAIWVLSNSTSGQQQPQIKYLVDLGCIQLLCKLLQVRDDQTVLEQTLKTIENILNIGKQQKLEGTNGINPYIQSIKDAGGFDSILELQGNTIQEDVLETANKIINDFFVR